MRMPNRYLLCLVILVPTILLVGAKSKDWMDHVPAREHGRSNPLHDMKDAARAGEILYADHCASCHGKTADGHGKNPPLRGPRLEHATDGDLHWLLVNGEMSSGMPSWGRLPDPQLWQIVSYLKTLNAE